MNYVLPLFCCIALVGLVFELHTYPKTAPWHLARIIFLVGACGCASCVCFLFLRGAMWLLK